MINKKSNIAGFTLIEIMVVMAIFIIFIMMSSDYIIQGFRSSTYIYEQASAIQNAGKVQDIMVKEIRKANRSQAGDYLLDTVQPQTFIFYSDVNSDGSTEKIRYFLENNTLKGGIILAVGIPSQYPAENEVISTLSNYINNNTDPIFTYYDKDNQLIANPSANKQSIRLINILVKINVTPSQAPLDYYLKADVQIRNLKDNL